MNHDLDELRRKLALDPENESLQRYVRAALQRTMAGLSVLKTLPLDPTSPPLPALLNDYIITESLPGHSFHLPGYRGWDSRSGVQVRIQFLPHFPFSALKAVSQSNPWKLRQRFQHPGFVHELGFGKLSGRTWIARTEAHGTLLSKIIYDNGAFREHDAASLIAGTARLLSHAHNAGLVHGSLTSDSILYDNGRVSIPNLPPRLYGQPYPTQPFANNRYRCKEQVTRTGADHRTDVYGLGFSLFRALTCQFPYDHATDWAEPLARGPNTAPPPSALRSSLSPEIDAITLKALAYDPEDRYQSAAELAEDLEALTRGDLLPVKRANEQPVEPARPQKRSLLARLFGAS